MKKPAFTLIEILVVITIITVLSGIFMLDFQNARQRQQVMIAAEQSLALLQQSHAEVQSGATNDGDWVCRGAYFEVGAEPEMVEAPLSGGGCDWTALTLSAYGMQGSAQVVSATTPYVLFMPPDGALILYDGVGSSVQDYEVVLGSDQVDSEFTLYVSSLTGQSSILRSSNEQ